MSGETVADTIVTDRLRLVTGRKVPGIAIAIAGPEGLRETAAAGYADLAAGEPASADMVCPWFSMTKIVTASLAMRLAGRGLLNLDQPVLSLVPELTVMRPRALAERITPRHLLTHSAGFANPIPVRWIQPADEPGPDQAALLTRLLARHSKLRFEPGTRSVYSNLSTLTLGQAIANAAGAPYAGLAVGQILQPLGMRMTGFAYTQDMLARAATGYHPRRRPHAAAAARLGHRRPDRPLGIPAPVLARWRRLRRPARAGPGRGPVPADAPARRRA
jgi:CubicO group peptidase (beta-lactamase class C family)